MPYSIAHSARWNTDPAFFGALSGAAELVAWFGFRPSFHDATIERMAFDGSDGTIVLSAFRMTSAVDESGFYIQDRHAQVSFYLPNVTGIFLNCHSNTTILELGIRRLAPHHVPVSNTAAGVGDYELAYDDVCGGSGSIYAREIRIHVGPRS